LSLLAPLYDVMAGTGLDAVCVVPGANFLRLFNHEFHQMERPLMVIVPAKGSAVAVVPNIELGSFTPLGFDGLVFDWRDEAGYMDAFLQAGKAVPQLAKGSRIGVEGQRMRVFDFLAVQKALPTCEFVDAHDEISSIRLRKTPDEIARLKQAISRSEAALEATIRQVRVGQTEKDIEAILLAELFRAGCDGLSFSPIVAAGDNAANSHAVPRAEYKIKAGDALLIDFGGRYQHFSADITRTFFVGHVSEADRAFYETVQAANARGRAVSRAGVTAGSVDAETNKILLNSQFAKFKNHKTGHGLGLDIHEAPQVMEGNSAKLEPGMVITIEPGLYRPGECGVRIEDNIVITETSHECLTSFPRDLRIIG
jgi:Xaa-Pro dipeptidase